MPSNSKLPKRDRAQIRPATGDFILSRREFGGKIGTSERTVQRMETSGKIPKAVRVSPGRVGHPNSLADAIISGRK